MKWTAAELARLDSLWEIHNGRFSVIAKAMGRTRGSIDGKSRARGLQFHGGRSRTLLSTDDAAVIGTTVFHRRAISVEHGVLKSGDNQRKLGKTVTKGAWKGMPIFSLTLEERATCPRSCLQWRTCYGNNMGHAKRYAHGAALERQIGVELRHFSKKFPSGFVLRLHILGDFYSVAYVEFWRQMLARHPAMRIFGYTARQSEDPIGAAIEDLRREQWSRFAVRTSGASSGPRTMVIADEAAAGGAIICPAQTGRTQSCSTCSLCWASQKPVAFLAH